MRRLIHTVLILAIVSLGWTGNADGTPPRQLDLGIRPLNPRAEKGQPVQLEFYYTKSIRQWHRIRLEFNPVGGLKYLGPEEAHLAIRKDTTVTFKFEVIPDPADTSGIVVIPWFDEGDSHLPVSLYFVPSGDSMIMRANDPRNPRNRPIVHDLVVEPIVIRSGGSSGTGTSIPPDSAKIRARLEQQKRDFAPYQLELELHERALLEQSPLTDLDAQHIRVGDTIFTRKRGEQYFYPAEKVSPSSPPSKITSDSTTSEDMAFGAIEGTVLGCDRQLLYDCRVDINAMPDSMVAELYHGGTRHPYNAEYFKNTEYHNSTRTDTVGYFRFDDLPIGYYQIWFWFDLRLSIRDSCERYQLSGRFYPQVDFVRVAPDSTSITRLSAQGDPLVKFAAIWFPEYKSSTKEGEKDEEVTR